MSAGVGREDKTLGSQPILGSPSCNSSGLPSSACLALSPSPSFPLTSVSCQRCCETGNCNGSQLGSPHNGNLEKSNVKEWLCLNLGTLSSIFWQKTWSCRLRSPAGLLGNSGSHGHSRSPVPVGQTPLQAFLRTSIHPSGPVPELGVDLQCFGQHLRPHVPHAIPTDVHFGQGGVATQGIDDDGDPGLEFWVGQGQGLQRLWRQHQIALTWSHQGCHCSGDLLHGKPSGVGPTA